MYIIHVSGKILLVANQMLPEPPLPDTTLSSLGPRPRYQTIAAAADKPQSCRFPLYHRPSRGEIITIRSHLPNAVKMIGQQHHTQHFKWTQRLNFDHGTVQIPAGVGIVKILSPVVCYDGKEISPAWTKQPSVFRHRSALKMNGAIHRTLPDLWPARVWRVQ